MQTSYPVVLSLHHLPPATEEALTSDSVPRAFNPALESFRISEGGGGLGQGSPCFLQASTLIPSNPASMQQLE